MSNKTAVMVLIALSVLLGIGLLMRHNAAEEQKRNDAAQIAKLDTNLKDTEGKLTDQKKVNESLLQTNAIITTNLAVKTEEAKNLTARVQATTVELTQTKEVLTKTQAEAKAAQSAAERAAAAAQSAEAAAKKAQADVVASRAETKAAEAVIKQTEEKLKTTENTLKTTQAKADADAKTAATRIAALEKSKTEEIAKRDASIKDLQTTRDELNAKIVGLNADIAKLQSNVSTLNARINLLEGELTVANNDKAFLTKELQRMQTERTETERKMNDLAFLREQMSTIKSDQAVARRVEWMRQGTFMDERKGAQLLNDGLRPLPAAKPTSTRGSQLNVEVHRDGTVTIRPPAPATKPAEKGVEKSVTVGPEFPAAPTPKK